MADFEKKVTLIEVEIDNKSAIANVDKLSGAILDQKKVAKDNNDQIKALNKTNQDLAKQVKAGTITQEEANKQSKANSQQAQELSKQNLNLQDGIKDLNKERTQAVKVSKLQSNSLDALRNKVAQQKKELNGLNTATEEGSKRFEELTKELEENNKAVVESDQAAGDFKTSIGDYSGKLGEATEGTGLFSGALGESKGAVTGVMGTVQQLFKVLLANPILLIVTLLAGLIKSFLDTQKGMDALTSVTRPLFAIFESLKGVVQDLATNVFDKLGSAMKDPIGTIKELGQIILDNIINRFKSVLVLGDAFSALMKGNLKEASKLAADGFIQMGTGVANATDKINAAKDSLVSFVKDGIDAGTQLDKITKKIEESEIALTTSRAALNTSFEKSKEIAEDVTNSEEERLAAAEKAISVQNQLLTEEQALIDLKIEKMKLEQTFNDSSREDLKELAELEAEKLNFEAEAAGKRTGVNNFLNSLKAQIAGEELGRIKTLQDAENKARDEKIKADEDAIAKKKEQDETLLANQRALDAKLLELDAFRREQQNEAALAAAESDEEKFELMLEQQAERFEIEQEVLAEQREIALENETLSNEEKLTVQADFDLQLEEMKQGNVDVLAKIDEDGIAAEEKRRDKAKKKTEKEAAQTAKNLQAISNQAQATLKGTSDAFFAAKNNFNDIQNKKENNDLIRQLNDGQITRQEFDQKKQQLDKDSARKAFEIQKKQFVANKILASIDNVINTAKGISQALGSFPPPASFVMAGLVGVLGLAQGIAIASEQPPSTPSFASGGDVFGFMVGGRSHAQGGTTYTGEDGNRFEVEKDEGIFVTKREATNPALSMLSSMNQQHGGRSMFSNPKKHLQEGGSVAAGSLNGDELANIVGATVANMPPQVVMVKDIMGGVNANIEAEETGVV